MNECVRGNFAVLHTAADTGGKMDRASMSREV